MRGFGRSAGFTLLEVGLAITVGTVIVAAGVFGYLQAKESAGDALARQRVADLQGLAESYFTTYNGFPTVMTLREQWVSQRTDCTKSPWGGDIGFSGENQVASGGLFGSDLNTAKNSSLPSSRSIGGPNDERSPFRDALYYYRLDVPGYRPEPPWTLWDAGKGSTVSVSAYAIGSNKHGRVFFFVTSGR